MNKLKGRAHELMLIGSMTIFGTIGIFVRYVPFPSGLIAFVRGAVGVLFLTALCALSRKKISFTAIKKEFLLLALSGTAIGFNWIFLFEAYRYTSVATATLCYYLAPVLVIAVSPIFLKERLTLKKLVCVTVALFGMVFVSGLHKVGVSGMSEMKGILFGALAAALYASVMIMNKKLVQVSAYDRTIVQLAVAAAVVLPYSLLAEDLSVLSFEWTSVLLLLVVGVIHTGVAYAMYFASLERLNAQTVAIFSYIDPIVAIVLSSVIFPEERMDILGAVGAVMILFSVCFAELGARKTK